MVTPLVFHSLAHIIHIASIVSIKCHRKAARKICGAERIYLQLLGCLGRLCPKIARRMKNAEEDTMELPELSKDLV